MKRAILITGAALLGLWASSFGLSCVDLGNAALPIALAIAAVKAALVGASFMELLKASASIRFTVAAAGALVAVLIGLMVADVETRDPSAPRSRTPLSSSSPPARSQSPAEQSPESPLR